MTWKELKDKISLMTEEEQRQEVAVWGENMNLMKDCSLEKTDEDMYYNSGWDYTCVDVEIPFYDDKKIRDMLNKASADIMKWCDKNMEKYNKELKESRSTKKHCEGLRKHIANLERRLLKHILANVILSIISVATIIALFTLIQN